MRITNNLTTSMLMGNIETGLDSLNTVQQEIATGKQLNLPSDNPAGAAQTLSMRASLVDNTQYQSDASDASSFLKLTDSSLTDVSSVINNAIQAASQGANSSQSTESQTALASQVSGMITQLTNIANTDYHGKYLFSGTMTNTAPFKSPTVDPANAYQGNTGSVTSTIGPNNVMTINTPGSTVFSPLFSTLNALQANLTSGNIDAISANITDLQNSLNTVTSTQATVGAKTNELTTVTQNLARAANDYQAGISNIEDVDLASAYVQLQSSQNVYQASLVATQGAYKYSLADYLH